MPFINAIGYVFMITMNALAIMLPLGGQSTQVLSERYNNPFTPIGFTFSIWSLIYLLLFIFTLIPLIRRKLSSVQKILAFSIVSPVFSMVLG